MARIIGDRLMHWHADGWGIPGRQKRKERIEDSG